MSGHDIIGTGLTTMLKGVAEAAKEASLSVGFGAVAMGAILMTLHVHFVTGSTMLAVGGFYVAARIGSLIDRSIEDRRILIRLQTEELQMRVTKPQPPLIRTSGYRELP